MTAQECKIFSEESILFCLSELKSDFMDFDRVISRSELDRMAKTASRIPLAQSEGDHLVDIGGTIMWLPIYSRLLHYKRISLVSAPGFFTWSVYGGKFDEMRLKRDFGCNYVPANVDVTAFGIASGTATCVVCFEVLEHLQGDPMHVVSEANRVLADGGLFYITTPNVLFSENLVRYYFGGHPFLWAAYTNCYGDRHNREYTPFELIKLLEAGGFTVDQLETLTISQYGGLFRLAGMLLSLFPAVTGRVPLNMRREYSHVRARRSGPVRERYPTFLYDLFGEKSVMKGVPYEGF